MDRLRRTFNILFVTGIVILAGSILAFGALGFFTRYMADDYCFGANVRNAPNFFAAQMNMYVAWSGRYSATFLVSLGDLFGPYNTVVWPLFTLAALVTTAAFFARQALPGLPRRLTWFFALLFVNYTYVLSPNHYQSYYWRPGIASYTLSIAGILLLSALILRFVRRGRDGLHRSFQMVLTALLAWLTGGFSETTGILLTGAVVLVLIMVLFFLNGPARRHAAGLLLAALFGVLVSLLLMAFAPGTAVRSALMPERPGVLTIVLLSLRYALGFVYNTLKSLPLPFLGLFGTSLLLSFGLGRFGILPVPPSLRKPWTVMLAITALTYALLVSIFLPGLFAYAAYADDRVLVLGAAILVAAAAAFSAVTGAWLASLPFKGKVNLLNTAALILFLLALLYPLRSAWTVSRQYPAFVQRSDAWDARHAQLVQDALSGVQDAQVVEFDSLFGLQELIPNPHEWVNECASSYYGLQSIQASEP